MFCLRKRKFDFKAFSHLPDNLKKSDYVDFLIFLNGDKPCIRIGNNCDKVYKEIIKWCKKYKYHYRLSDYGLMYIFRRRIIGLLAQRADDSVLPHTIIFGLLLGYPFCCCRKIKRIGEKNIDSYERFIKNSKKVKFVAPYDKIKPHSYLEGTSFISHIPCSPCCRKSLRIAERSYRTIYKYQNEDCMKEWKNALQSYFKD